MPLAHLAGLPVEEVVAAAAVGGWLGLSLAWLRAGVRRRAG
jgi:hypothetical protein